MKSSRTVVLLLMVLGIGGYIFLFERHNLSVAERKAFEQKAFQIDADDVTALGIRTPAYDIELLRGDEGWALREPEGARASEAMVRRTLSRLETLERGELITPRDMRQRGVTLADFGLYVPKTVFTIRTVRGLREFRVGDPNPLRTSVYIKEEGSQNVMLVSTDLLETLPAEEDVFYDASLFSLGVEQVESFSLVQRDATVRLQRQTEGWAFTEPRPRPADDARVQGLLTRLLRATAEGYINRPDENGTYGFEDRSERFRIGSPGNPVEEELILGGIVSGQPGRIYAKLEGRGGLLLVSRGLRDLVQTPTQALRPSSLISTAELDAVSSVEMEQGSQVLTLSLDGGRWKVKKPFERLADADRMQGLIRIWSSAVVVAFDQQAEGVQRSHRIRFLDASGRILKAYDLLQVPSMAGRSLVRDADSGEVFRVTPDLTTLTSTDPTTYLPRNPVSVDASRVVRMDLMHEGERLEFTRAPADSAWTLNGRDVHQASVTGFLSRLVRLKADRLFVASPEERADLGLTGEIRISLGLNGEAPSNLTLLINRMREPGLCGIQILGDDLMYELPAETCEPVLDFFRQYSAGPNQNEDSSHEEVIRNP